VQLVNETIILWDLDGTLIGQKDSNNNFSSHNIFLTTLDYKIKTEPIQLSGLTDYEVLVNTLIMNDIPVKEINLDELMQQFDNFYFENFSSTIKSLVSIINADDLNTLRQSFEFGILTGNTKMRCMLKLAQVGLKREIDSNFIFYCDGNKSRLNLVQKAYQEICLKLERQIVVIGDTPSDVLSASSLGVPAISIASGKYSQDELRCINKGLVLKNFDILEIVEFVSSI
jgi:phosphoglycolate phosphatase-like HAD superfamily hydrolase